MIFFADKQTLEDLNIPGRYKNSSIARMFDRTITAGGLKLMDDMFRNPLTDEAVINSRSAIFKHFGEHAVSFPFSGEEFSVMENYLTSGAGNTLIAVTRNILVKKMLQLAAQDTEYETFRNGVMQTVIILNRFYGFICNLEPGNGSFNKEIELVKTIYNNPGLQWLQEKTDLKNLSLLKLIRYDRVFRGHLQKEIEQLIDLIFSLDVFIAVSQVAIEKGFAYARAHPKAVNVMNIAGLFHPAVKNAVGNSLILQENNNIIFLTGANMAGKSTLMKSFGIAVYLAHMGFPIAAEHMEFSVKDGLYSSINVSDNLDLGYSHFYAEVLRVKNVAEAVATDHDLIVIFDELFKGTNVKDAYDATLAITEAFSVNRNCFFVISTHITEVGETLRQRCENFRFAYLPTIMEGTRPRYTYKLTDGITKDRHGMTIIENEGILDIIRGGQSKLLN